MADKPHTYCIHDEGLIRNHEAVLATITTSLKDFMARYENDKRECMERNRSDREEAREWRGSVDKRMDKIDLTLEGVTDFIKEMKPNYKRAMVMWGAVILGAIGIIWKMIWDHVGKP